MIYISEVTVLWILKIEIHSAVHTFTKRRKKESISKFRSILLVLPVVKKNLEFT